MAYHITEDCCGCTLCAQICPVMAIVPDQRHGPSSAKSCRSCANSESECPVAHAPKQPQMVNPRRCVDCGVCGRVCPKGAIVDAAGNQTQRIPRKDWSKPVIDTANCSACGICVNMWCTAGALGITRPQFRGDINAAAWLADAKKCVGCGLCASECPMGAVRMESEKVCSTARHC